MTRWPLAAAAAALLGVASLGATGAAQAATQVYNIDVACPACGVSSPFSFGTVTVTEIANQDLSVSVSLTSGISLHRNQNANQHALTFSLVGNPTVTISALSDARLQSNGAQAAGSHNAPPFGSWDYAINFESGVRGPPSSPLSSFSFIIGGAAPLSLASLESSPINCASCIPSGLHNIFFTLDISNGRDPTRVYTGNVGASIAAGVPEPSTWAMMLIGFAGLGWLARRRRAAVAA